jgi:hypothetical protein
VIKRVNARTGASAGALMAAALVAAVSVGGSTTSAFAMQGYKWKNRPLLVFAPAPDSRKLTRQRRVFVGEAAGFRERDIVVVSIVGGQTWTWLGGGPGLTADQLRSRFGVGRREFRAILVGKDGGVKISSSEPLTKQRLFSTIDAMPMRQQEMRKSR